MAELLGQLDQTATQAPDANEPEAPRIRQKLCWFQMAADAEDDLAQRGLLDRAGGFIGREPAEFAFFLFRPIF
jgi:hypothetical protein